MTPTRLAAIAVLAGLLLIPVHAARRAVDPGAIFRVFLQSGAALPSYGESAIVGDRVVFALLVGETADRPTVQLMSLPVESVDVARTRRYANAVRARHYANTRGELDYAAVTEEVRRTIGQLPSVADPKRRLALAEEARRHLGAWSETTYGYRAADVRELTRLFDEVIAELRTAAGERSFDLDLRMGPDDSPPEALMAAPSLQDLIYLALAAARAADSDDERVSVLRAAERAAAEGGIAPDVRALVRRELDVEADAAAAYTQLFEEVRTEADAARRRGDVAGVESALAALRARDHALGSRRRQSVEALISELEAMVDTTKSYRAALDHYAEVRGSLLAYERTVRPIMSGFDGLTPVFTAVREFKYTAYERLERTSTRLAGFRKALAAVRPPEDLADVQATLTSALQMADYACARRRLAVSTRNETMDREASSAAAGALMLASLAREQLVARLYPPAIK